MNLNNNNDNNDNNNDINYLMSVDINSKLGKSWKLNNDPRYQKCKVLQQMILIKNKGNTKCDCCNDMVNTDLDMKNSQNPHLFRWDTKCTVLPGTRIIFCEKCIDHFHLNNKCCQ